MKKIGKGDEIGVQEDGVNIEIMEHGHNVYIMFIILLLRCCISQKGLFQKTVFHVFVSQRNICGHNGHSQKESIIYCHVQVGCHIYADWHVHAESHVYKSF